MHPAEAATILRHLSLAGNSRRVEGIDEEARNRAVEAVRLRLTPFARELVSSLQFYQTQPDSLGIGEIVITGGTSQLDGLGDALHQMIGVQVKVGDPLQRLTVRKGVESGFEQSIGSLAVPIGLAIDDDPMRSVDLTPRDVVSQRRRVEPGAGTAPGRGRGPAGRARALLLAGARQGLAPAVAALVAPVDARRDAAAEGRRRSTSGVQSAEAATGVVRGPGARGPHLLGRRVRRPLACAARRTSG